MKYLLAMFAVAFLATGCVQNQEAANARLRSVLAETCPAVDVAYEYYRALTDVISARTQQRVELAKAQVDRLCASPSTATVTTTLTSGAAAYLAISAAVKEARASGAAGVGYPAGKLQDLADKIRRTHG